MIRPVFVFDGEGEDWFPVDALAAITAGKARVPKSFIWAPDAPRRADGIEALDFPRTMQPKDLAGLPAVGYHRMRAGGGLFWSQHWLAYAYNPWNVGGVGEHEFDWEFVQIGCADPTGTRPVLVTCSQHHSGGKREFWACELEDGRPVVYVARGSHATYFAPGRQGAGDVCDGKGRVLRDVSWRSFGAWAGWPGRWGNSRGSGQSPLSPGRQGHRWTAPHLFHSAAR